MKQSSYIYLASPYSHKDDAVKCDRYEAALEYTAIQSGKGEVIFSPIVHSHFLAETHRLAGDWEFWSKIDYVFIDNCEKVRVLKLPGWEESRGVKAEVEYAKEQGIDIEYVDFSPEARS